VSNRKQGRGASRTQSDNQHFPAPVVFTAGALFGAIVSLIIWSTLSNSPSTTIDSEPNQSAQNTGQSTTSDFQFYTLLNEMEVPVPTTSENSRPETENIYWLQAGSFRSEADADELRAMLLLQNLEARISDVISQDVLWHRVMVGPFASRTQMASARQALVESQIQPLLVVEKRPIPQPAE
jgi:cell division protein FtsN